MSSSREKKSFVVFLSTFPPRACGIGTFTEDLAEVFDTLFSPTLESRIIAMNPEETTCFIYPSKVLFAISEPRLEDYACAAKQVRKMKQVRLVNIQHEFGIFGGEHGAHVVQFMEHIGKPTVVTLHTVPSAPGPAQRKVMALLVDKAHGIIVMTERSRLLLRDVYGAPDTKVQVIPHGIHHLPYATSDEAKEVLGFRKRVILTTFGLLSRRKGIQYVLEALPAVVRQFPEVLYLVVGATHPTVLTKEGETYREYLMKKVRELGLERHVRFYNRYFPLRELLQFLQATDIYLATSLDPDHTVSGTLTYALGAGRPVVATAFAQAKEYITDEVGILVDFKNPEAYTEAVCALLGNSDKRQQMGKNAYFRTRSMIWPNVALAYLRFFGKFVPGLAAERLTLPPIKLTHLFRLTNEFGIFQFAELTKPNLAFGYTVDDNARALIAASLAYARKQQPATLRLIHTYLRFLEYAAKPNLDRATQGGRPLRVFENYIDKDRRYMEEENERTNLEDANARALYALMCASMVYALPREVRRRAWHLVEQGLQIISDITFPRAVAFFVKGLAFALVRKTDTHLTMLLRRYADRLVSWYATVHEKNWEWFEDRLTYANAVLPEALLSAYRLAEDARYKDVGITTLEFLIKKTFENGMYMPIGQGGWYKKGGKREYFDQQSEDAAAMVQALRAAYKVTKEERYRKLVHKAFNWFLGENVLGQVVYDRVTGGCYDGIGKDYVNLNQGAESTISYLLARLALEALQ